MPDDDQPPGVTGSFLNSRGIRIETKTWAPEGKAKGAVVFLHGWGMSSTENQAWTRVSKAHTESGLLCTALDYEGHGKSGGSRSYINMINVSSIVDDVLQHVNEFTQQHSGLPLFLRGQSLGSVVAIMAALREPSRFQGIALGAPPYEFAGVLGVLDSWKLLQWHAVAAASAYVRQEVAHLKMSMAVFQGIDDTTCSPSGARRLFQSSGSPDKSLYLYKSMGHNMSMEPDVLAWMMPRCVPPGTTALGPDDAKVQLHVRSPLVGVAWPPPPGDAAAASNTTLESFLKAEDQARVLDELLPLR